MIIYFIQVVLPNGEPGPIKIGQTDHVLDRLRTLQTASPWGLRLLHSYVGSDKDEAGLHQRFGAIRMRGEWFRPEPALLGFIERERAGSVAAAVDVFAEDQAELDAAAEAIFGGRKK